MKPNGAQSFSVDGKLLDADGKETSVSVVKISSFWKTVSVTLSDGNVFVFKGFPYIVSKK